MSAEKGWSITWVCVLVIALTLAVGWCFLAGEYAKEAEGWVAEGGGLVRGRASLGGAAIVAAISFGMNGLQQIPNALAVVEYSYQNQFWTVIGFTLFIGLLIGGAFAMKYIERELNKPMRRRR